ncbi:hypothetical protein [Microscilla marina]|uniref:hypothetical protein n=1 Tax=Microscilla marina TaxID=1027 RepID=UPI000301F8AE|nr:hypothetical protein [Microscilla marina]
MRKRLPDIASSGALPIETIKISKNARSSRDALPRLLFGLQELYSNKEILGKVLDLIEKEILSDKMATGRPGLSLWQILVLGVVRVGKGLSYASLLDLANNHRALRGILGLGGLEDEFSEQTLLGNVHLLTIDLLQKVNGVLMGAESHWLKKTAQRY